MTHQLGAPADEEPVKVAQPMPPVTTDDVFGDGEQPKPEPSFLEQMRAERESLIARVIELRAPIPSWDKRLIAVFSPLDDTKRKRLAEAQVRLKTDSQARDWTAGMIGESCTGLFLDGVDIGSGLFGGFGPDFAFIVGLPASAAPRELVWSAFGKDETALATFRNGLNRWFADPTPTDLSNEVDVPFGSA